MMTFLQSVYTDKGLPNTSSHSSTPNSREIENMHNQSSIQFNVDNVVSPTSIAKCIVKQIAT